MTLTAASLLCIVFTAALHGQMSDAELARQFRNPAKAYRPMVRWWWPGNDVQDAELRREIDLLDRANFGGAEIQAFNKGLQPDMPTATRRRVNDYLTPNFFAHVQTAVDAARARGMWIDYTFGSGWPFGGAGVVTPALASVELRSAEQVVRGPGHIHLTLTMPTPRPDPVGAYSPEWQKQFEQRRKLVAVVALRDVAKNGTEARDAAASVLLTDHVQGDGTLDWDAPPGTWRVFTFLQLPTHQLVNAGIGGGPQLVLDHMSRAAFDAYAERVGVGLRSADGKDFGKGLRAIFCDSLEVVAWLYWSDDFLDQFQRRRGYDLTPYLPYLRAPTKGEDNVPAPARDEALIERVRRDYGQTVSDVMTDNFYLPFDAWAKKNNLLSRVQAHGSPTDWLRVYGASSIPETEDLYADGRYDFLKLASSAADLYGRSIVSSESFVWGGEIYKTTPEKMKRYADELITAGVNEIIDHGYPYQYMDRPFPGWQPFALVPGRYSSDLNQTSPFWPYFGRLNAYIARLQFLSQAGKSVVPILLYRGPLPYVGAEPSPAETTLNTDLFAAGYNFDDVDDSSLLQSSVKDGHLLSPAGTRYECLVLQDQKWISPELAEQLRAFARAGLPIVILGGMPTVLPRISRTGQAAVEADTALQPGAGRMQNASSDAQVVALLEKAVAPNLHFDGEPLSFLEKRVGNLDVFFLRNPDDTAKQTTVTVSAAGTPELWDAWSGAIHSVAGARREGPLLRVPLHLEAYGMEVLVIDPAGTPQASRSSDTVADAAVKTIRVGGEGWHFHGVGIGPGSRHETIDRTLPQLVDWAKTDGLSTFSGRGTYRTVVDVSTGALHAHGPIVLDLGDVRDVAEVRIDGRPGPILLLRPYRADIRSLLHPGRNTLEITVVNTLYNSLAAGESPRSFRPDSPGRPNTPRPAGLIGPVELQMPQSSPAP